MGDGMLPGYQTVPGRYDEAFDDRARPRAHWTRLAHAAAVLAPEETLRRAQFIRRSVEQDGVTYNIYADPKGADRPWELDQLPLVIGADEWRFLSKAIEQRARLLDAILADLYGPGRLLAAGLLPPALVFGHHNYLWACRGWKPRGGTYLHLYGCDVARSADGRWWAIGDRTQGPSGAGYALQNRLIVAPLFGQTFRAMNVQRLAQFFRTLQRELAANAPTDGEPPVVALLTPGPYNETYFEHVFLARYLGFALVEGSDLTVRNDRVYLKTLEGLRRVHVLLRRLDDEYCDPAALRADSAIGVPGLVAAARAGHVLVANALGSGVLEMPALNGFLPAICEALLGEPLALPSVATWWCGEKPALEHVIAHMPELVIKPAYPSMRLDATFGHELDAAGRAAMATKLRATPHAYVAQEWVRLSQAPAWSVERGVFEPRGVGLRLFAVASGGTYKAMPGGLARVAPDARTDVITMQRGGSSKDTWVLDTGRTPHDTLLQSRIGVKDLVRGGPFSPSRAVENLFWLGRYSERIEDIARLLRTTILRLVESDPTRASELDALVALCRQADLFQQPDPQPGATSPSDAPPDPSDESLLLAAVRDTRMPNGLPANIGRLHFCASQLRERVSLDNWHAVQRLARLHRVPPPDLDGALALLDQVMPACTSLAGYALDDMTRDEAWRFLVIGRRLERLGFLASMLARVARMDEDDRDAALTGMLEIANSIITYRSRYQRAPEALPVFDLLVLDETNPHSVAFQLVELQRDIDALTAGLGPVASVDARRQLAALRAFDLARIENLRLPYGDSSPWQDALPALLVACERFAYGLSDEISQRFFAHAGDTARRTLAA
jgi:uncharacterized circularly permuted ATP-grasp superfamily protein/uncharacterized alpha-E superfamily protein